MSAEEKRDLGLAIKVVVVALILGVTIGFWIGSAMACESYEECMDSAKKYAIQSCINSYEGSNAEYACADWKEPMEPAYDKIWMSYFIRGVNFKLAEISRKLDPKSERPTNLTDIMMEGMAKNRKVKENNSVGI